MRFGVCAGIDKAALLADAGYDYIELSASGDLLPDKSDEEWAEKRAAIEALPLPAQTFNLFLRGLRVTGETVDPDALRRWVDTATRRAALVGGELIVFGSGGARNVQEGFPRERAEAQIIEFLNLCADAYEKNGVYVVIEPLNLKECNILTSVAETAGYVDRIGRPGVRNLADTYHMEADAEPLSHLVDYKASLAHAHTADSGRRAPGTGTYDHVEMFRKLAEAGYDARVSVECKTDDFSAEIPPALVHLKRAYGAAHV